MNDFTVLIDHLYATTTTKIGISKNIITKIPIKVQKLHTQINTDSNYHKLWLKMSTQCLTEHIKRYLHHVFLLIKGQYSTTYGTINCYLYTVSGQVQPDQLSQLSQT